MNFMMEEDQRRLELTYRGNYPRLAAVKRATTRATSSASTRTSRLRADRDVAGRHLVGRPEPRSATGAVGSRTPACYAGRMENAALFPARVPGLPVHCLREMPKPAKAGRPASQRADEPDHGAGRDRLLCAVCGQYVSNGRARMEVGGGHRHTFFNPHGQVFELGVFSQAPGCTLIGPPTTEFTWFPGHAWTPAVCRGCLAHLGWLYEPAGAGAFGGGVFWGLILAMLVEAEGRE